MQHTDIMVMPTEMGRDPEMADVTNPHGIRWGWVAHVVVEDEDGSRLAHNQGFVSYNEDDAAASADVLRSKVAAHLAAEGKLNLQHWFDVDPRYGSDAYIKGGYEQQQVWREKEAA